MVRSGVAPRPIVLARGSGKVVVAYGQEAASAALSPDETLGDTELYERAEDLLGDGLEPSVLVAVPPILSLVDSSGSADREWQEVKRYVEAFDVLAIGSGTDDDHARARVAAGLR